MRKALLAAVASLALSAGAANADAASVSGTLSITVSPPAFALVLNPSSATEACAVAGGTVVSTASVTGGDGNAVTFSMTGNTTDFVIGSATGVVTVAPAGVVLADCGKSYTNTVTATQP
jgi:hypothetical protein